MGSGRSLMRDLPAQPSSILPLVSELQQQEALPLESDGQGPPWRKLGQLPQVLSPKPPLPKKVGLWTQVSEIRKPRLFVLALTVRSLCCLQRVLF